MKESNFLEEVYDLINNGNLLKAKEMCYEELEKNSNNAEAYIGLSSITEKTSNEYELIDQLATKAIKLDNTNYIYYYKFALIQYRRAHTIKNSNAPDQLVQTCFINAINLLKTSLKIFPSYFEACLLLAKIYLDNKDFVNSKNYFKLAWKIKPSDGVSHYYLFKLSKQ